MINKKTTFIVHLITMLFSMLLSIESNAKYIYSNLHNNHEIVAKYEHGGNGYEAIGKDNYNGYSYGRWQISTKRVNGKLSTFDYFLIYLEKHDKQFYTTLISSGGYNAAFHGNKNFIQNWKNLSKEENFKKIYDAFILDTQIIIGYKLLEKENRDDINKIINWSLTDDIIQASLHSSIIQHGPMGNYRLIIKMLETNKISDKESLLKYLYQTRSILYPKYKRRYSNEYNDLKVGLKNDIK